MTTVVSPVQQVLLVLLRTVIGWHFLYEGLYKLAWPAWSRTGAPLEHWTAAGYLRAASGPFSGFFHTLASPPWIHGVDVAVSVALVLVGVSLLLGLFTQTGAVGALLLLALFYVSAIPTSGLHLPGGEGAYLYVNKNLVEAFAVAVVYSFRTGRIAGLDLLRDRRRRPESPAEVLAS